MNRQLLRWFTKTPDRIALSALVGGILLLTFPVWLSGNVFAHFDLASITIPLEELFRRSQLRGELPLWAPEIQGGYPLIANGVASFFYPPHLLLRSVLPGVWVANVSLALHLGMAALGMWLLLRAEGFARMPTAGGTLLFTGGGFFIGHIGLAHLLFPAAWVPLLCALIVFWWRTGAVRFLLWCMVGTALFVLSGHIQMVLYAGSAVALFAGALLLRSLRTPWTLWRMAAILVVPGTALMLTAVHWLPLQELFSSSARNTQLSGPELTDVSYPPAHVLTWVFPSAFGHGDTYRGGKNEFELASTMGILGTVLGIIALFLRRTYRSFLGWTGLICVLLGAALALGEHSLLYRFLLREYPWVTRLANPARWFFLVHLGWSFLVAVTLGELSRFTRQQRLRFLGLSCVIGGGIGIFVFQALSEPMRAVVATSLFRFHWHTVVPLLALLALGALWGLRRLSPTAMLAGTVVLLGGELLAVGSGWNPTVPARVFLDQPAALSFLASAPEGRVFPYERLFADHRPDFGPAIWNSLTAGTVLQQDLQAFRGRISALEFLLSWGNQSPQPESVVASLSTPTGIHTAHVDPAYASADPDWLRLVFPEPVTVTENSFVTVHLTSTYSSRQSAPRAYIFTNSEGTDRHPAGRLKQCTEDVCQTVRHDSPAGPDLAVRLQYATSPLPPVLRARELLQPLMGESLGARSIRGHLPLQFPHVATYLRHLGERHEGVTSGFNFFLREHRDMLDRFGIRWLLASYEEHEQLNGMEQVVERKAIPLGERTIRLYENMRVYPRIHIAEQVQQVPGGEEGPMLQLLQQERVPRSAVVAEGGRFTERVLQHIEEPEQFDSTATARLLAESTQHLRIQVQANREAFLVVRDTFAPGWRAWIDDRPTTIFRTDMVFRGIVVPPGDHVVTLRYLPSAFRKGALTSGIAWSFLLLALLLVSVGKSYVPRLLTTKSATRPIKPI